MAGRHERIANLSERTAMIGKRLDALREREESALPYFTTNELEELARVVEEAHANMAREGATAFRWRAGRAASFAERTAAIVRAYVGQNAGRRVADLFKAAERRRAEGWSQGHAGLEPAPPLEDLD